MQAITELKNMKLDRYYSAKLIGYTNHQYAALNSDSLRCAKIEATRLHGRCFTGYPTVIMLDGKRVAYRKNDYSRWQKI